MPELPEVETIRGHLAPHVEGRILRSCTVDDERWCRPLAPAELSAAVDGRAVERLSRRGKYLIWELEGEVFLICHLRMTGTILLDPEPGLPHARVSFDLGEHRLVWSDPRRFGTGELALGEPARDAFFAARLGIEPLDEEAFTAAYLRGLARNCRAPVKAFLLDQKRIAGVGNIYADEALFRARIHPLRPANALTAEQCGALRDAVIDTLRAGIAAKGATIDDFRDPYGVQGSFQDQFLVHLREGEPCPECGRPVRKLRAAGRGTYVCERCQPVPDGDAVRVRPPRYAADSSRSRPSRSMRTSS